mgnify:CR=1 FL=1|tara:strand:+ start:665 stop:1903 length:1239 start_codon:yes stop_codon:yes gene_type:complete
MTIQNIANKIVTKSRSLVKGVTQSVRKNAKIKKRIRVARKRYERRKRLEKKRREQLKALQQSKEQQKGKVPEKDDSPSPMQRLINAITALLIGFVVNKLPEIIEFVKKIIDFIKGLIDGFKGFFDGVKEFFSGVGKVFEKAKDILKSLTLENIKKNITKFIDKLKNSFGEIKDKLLGGIKNFLGLKKKDPKKEDLNKDLEDGNDKDKTITQSPVGEIRDNLSEKNGEFDKTLETIKKEGTGVEIIGDKNREFTSEVDDINSMENRMKRAEEQKALFTEKLKNTTNDKKKNLYQRKIDEADKFLEKGKFSVEKQFPQVEQSNIDIDPSKNTINQVYDGMGFENNSIKSNVKVKNMNLSKFEPKRKSANTIVVANKGDSSSQDDASVSGGAVLTSSSFTHSNPVQDSLNLALSE